MSSTGVGRFHDVVDRLGESVTAGIEAFERGESNDNAPTRTVVRDHDVIEPPSPLVLELIEAIRREPPESIHEAGRVLDRDQKCA